MVTEKALNLKKTVPFLVAGVLIFVAYLYFFGDIPRTLAIIQTVDLLDYGLAVAALFLSMVTAALTWQYFLKPLSVKVAFRKTFLFTWIGTFVDLIVPAESISGDASKIYLMSKETGDDTGKIVASVVSNRILAMIISLGSLIFSSVALFMVDYTLPAFVFNIILLIVIGTTVSLVFIFLCVLKQSLTQRIIDAVLRFVAYIARGRLNLENMRNKATNALNSFHCSIGCLLKSPKNLALPVLFSIVSWILSILLSYFVFISLGQHVDFILILVVYSISVNVQSIPIGIPAEVGFVEIIMSSLYGLLGIDAGIAVAATILTRLLLVWVRIFVGLIAVHWIDLKDLAKNLRQDLF
ncbi:MAG: lysylphosphatidylglycerol synthase transmembrane domain-containing protein [Candidatus Bathyarchaeia archaeon]|jgi:uncharacterized protein (TIRG00374 family)